PGSATITGSPVQKGALAGAATVRPSAADRHANREPLRSVPGFDEFASDRAQQPPHEVEPKPGSRAAVAAPARRAAAAAGQRRAVIVHRPLQLSVEAGPHRDADPAFAASVER